MIYSEETFDENLKEYYRKIGRNVKRARKLKNISQLELAQLLNYKSVATISNAEVFYDNHHFSLAQLYKISLVLDIEMNFLTEP